jgi:hypothetical protein
VSGPQSGLLALVLVRLTGYRQECTPEGRSGLGALLRQPRLAGSCHRRPWTGQVRMLRECPGVQGPKPSPTTVQRMFTAPALRSPLRVASGGTAHAVAWRPLEGVPGRYASSVAINGDAGHEQDSGGRRSWWIGAGRTGSASGR